MRPSPSSRAVRWRTSLRSRPRAGTFCRRPGGTSTRTGSSARRPCAFSCGAKVHVTVTRALRLLGLGAPRDRRRRRSGTHGRGRVARGVARRAGPTIVCAQAGEVNTGAFDPLPEIADAARAAGAWLHVDGAFGLWAAASPSLAHSSPARSSRTHGRPTRTNGSTSPTTAGSSFCAHPDGAPRRDRRRTPSISCTATRARCATRSTGRRSSRAARAASRSTRRCARSGGAASPRSSSARCAHARRFAERARRAARVRAPQRRRPQPGALPVRLRRAHR